MENQAIEKVEVNEFNQAAQDKKLDRLQQQIYQVENDLHHGIACYLKAKKNLGEDNTPEFKRAVKQEKHAAKILNALEAYSEKYHNGNR